MRKHISCYVKGLKDASEIRNKINQLQSRSEVKKVLEEYFQSLL